MEKEAFVYQVFEQIAGDYDAANDRISLGLHRRWKRQAVRQMLPLLPQGARVLDLCCGTGDMTALLLESRPDLRVFALDFSPAMLRAAQARFGAEARVELRAGNALAPPYPENSMDGAVISFALRNTADYTRVLREMMRVCRRGAPICVIDSFVPGSHVIRPFYRVYFSLVMPLLGGGQKHRREYRWLNESTEQFLSPGALAAQMRACGLLIRSTKRFMCGSCVSICAQEK